MPHVGRSTCNTPFHTGADALDPDALNTFLESHGLTALNTWCGPPQPTQFNQAPNKKIGTSQIDFIITRLNTADAQAKRVNVSKPPIGTWRLHIGHFGLEANLRVMNHYLLPARRAANVPIDNIGLDAAARGHDPRAQQLREAVAYRVEQCLEGSPAGCTDINQVLVQACQETFPATAKPPAPQNEVVQHLWRLRAEARYTAVQAKRTGRLFAAWKAAIRYHLAAKKATKACHAKKRQEILDLLQHAEDAAQQGDQRKVYQMVKKLAPWAPRNRVLLKDDNGKLTTKKEEHDCLVSFSKALFSPQTEQPNRNEEVLPLVFTLEEVQHELQITQVGKAVPPGVAPAAAWRISADLVAPLLQQAFAQHATLNAVLPERWTDAWIVWLPKPGKAPSNPAALRPIGLMSPEAKTLAAIIRNRLLEHIRPQLAWVPQFAYLPQRDITDALARVHCWMRKYDQVIAKAAPGRFALRARVEAGTQNELCVGGAILSLDLKQAFDRVNRQALVQALRRLQAPEELVAAVIALHDTSAYHIHDNFSETKVTTTRGIRQGCKLAPLLWVAISTAILHDLGPALSGPHKQATTFADDTLCQWLIETEQDVHDFARFLAHLLQVMRALGLHVNLTKTFLLIRARGTGAQRALRQHIIHKEGARWWRVETADGPALIPLAKSVIYLGTYLTLGNCALPGVKHRLQEAKSREAKIHRAVRSRRILSLAYRLRIWRACAVSSATFGLTPLGMTYPAATLLRGWFYKQLRAVTNTPAHLSHVSNADLSTKHGVPDPIDQLEQCIRQKREKLQNKENDITNTTDIQHFWEQTHLAYKELTTTTLQDSPVIPVAPTITGLACPECGVYFPSTKTLRQHLALKHKKLVTIDPEDAKNYQSHLHSINGMPQCKHCKKNLQTWGALRQHVLTYACRPRESLQTTPPPCTPNSPNEGEPHPAPRHTLPSTSPPNAEEHWEGEASTRQEEVDVPASASTPDLSPELPVLRRPENKQALLTPPVALTTLHAWAKELNTRCGFCRQWIAKNGSVKEHIKRMHPAIWDACLDSFDEDCSHYRDIIQRDRDCELCDQKVHTADRHMRNCVVLFQVAVASAWHRAGAPEHSENTQVNPSMFTAQIVKKLLEEPTVPAPQEDKPLLTFLERHCALCSHAVVNQQDWRRRMKKCHDLEWISAQAGISGTLEGIALSRPCKFCRVAYTKTPRLHTTKCLPLLQLSFLRHHVRDLSSDVGSRQHVGRSQPDARGPDGRRTPTNKVSQEGRKGSRKDGKTAPGAADGPAQRTETGAPPHASQDDGKARDGASATGGRQILGDLRGFWKPGNHQPADEDNSHVEETEIEKRVLLQPQTGPYGGNAHGARSEDGQAGDRCIGPDPASEGEDPLAGPLAVAVHEVELRPEGTRAHQRGAAGTHNGPDGTSRTEVPHLARGHDARIPCNGRHERGERGCHAVQVDPVDGVTSQNIHSRNPYPIHGVLDAPADRSPAAPGEEPQAAAERVAAASSARAVRPPEGEPSSAPAVPGEVRDPQIHGEPFLAPNLITQSGSTVATPTVNLDKGRPRSAPKTTAAPTAPRVKGRPKSAPIAEGGSSNAPVQTIFSMGRTKTIETLPAGVLPEDLQRNDRHKGAQGKLHFGPQTGGNISTAGKLSTTTTTGKEAGNLSAWLLRGAARKPALPGKNNPSARTTFSATDLARPVQTILANPSNYCYLNSLVQALLWVYQARPSARNSEFGDLHTLLRPLLATGTTVQLHRRKAWVRLLETWPNPQQQHDVAELLVHLQRHTRFPALEGKWEARTLQGPHFQIHQSATQVPHIMLPCQPNRTLQELVEQWAYDQDTGQICAVSEAPTFLCIQLLRFQGNMTGEINKLSHVIPLSPKLQVPTFADGIDTRPQAYVLHSIVYHIGCTPESGHYRTMGITAPKGEPSSLQEAFYSEITRSLSEGAAHPALHVQNDETPTALATSTDLQEVSRTWYLAFFSKPQ